MALFGSDPAKAAARPPSGIGGRMLRLGWEALAGCEAPPAGIAVCDALGAEWDAQRAAGDGLSPLLLLAASAIVARAVRFPGGPLAFVLSIPRAVSGLMGSPAAASPAASPAAGVARAPPVAAAAVVPLPGA